MGTKITPGTLGKSGINLASADADEQQQQEHKAAVMAERVGNTGDPALEQAATAGITALDDTPLSSDPYDVEQRRLQARRNARPKLEDEPNTKILFAASDSYQLFIDLYIHELSREGFRVARDTSYSVKLTKGDPIEGLPAASGGCTVTINPGSARAMGITWEQLLEKIYEHNSYGTVSGFAFLDDKEGSRPIMAKMFSQARKEARVLNEVMVDGILRSDLALPEDRIY